MGGQPVIMQRKSLKFRVPSLLPMQNISLLIVLFNQVAHLGMAAGSPTNGNSGSPLSCNQTCDQAAEGIDAFCNNRNLTVIPQHCSHIVFLDMRVNNISQLPRGVFEGFEFLQFLDLSLNSLETLQSGTFDGAPQLMDVYLFKNRLSSVHHDAFSGAGNIRGIYLSKNAIPWLPASALRGLPLLEYFFISRNRLTVINRHLFKNNGRLTHASFAYNHVEVVLPETFRHLTKLEYIDLSHNRLHYIGRNFGNLQSLRIVKMANSTLDSIPYDFLSSPQLEVADLSDNRITSIRPDWNPPALGAVRLMGNPLECDCSFVTLQSAYLAKIVEMAGDDPEEWSWVNEVNCSDGERLVNASSIQCQTTTTRPGQVEGKDSRDNSPIEFYPEKDTNFPLPLIIVAVIVSFFCLAVCVYVTICWVIACFKEREYQKVRSRQSSASSIEKKTQRAQSQSSYVLRASVSM